MDQMGLLSDPFPDRELVWLAKAQLSGRTETETQFWYLSSILSIILASEYIKRKGKACEKIN